MRIFCQMISFKSSKSAAKEEKVSLKSTAHQEQFFEMSRDAPSLQGTKYQHNLPLAETIVEQISNILRCQNRTSSSNLVNKSTSRYRVSFLLKTLGMLRILKSIHIWFCPSRPVVRALWRKIEAFFKASIVKPYRKTFVAITRTQTFYPACCEKYLEDIR